MDPLRIIDANANRAREGLRTLEEAARFLLDDAELSAEAKSLRHDLVAALRPLGRLSAARDVIGDVGTAISAAGEGRREDVGAVAAAAAARTTEAMRAIEEWSKPLGSAAEAGVPAAVEACRYRAYELERRLLAGLEARRRPQWTCCVLLTEAACRHPWDQVLAAALDGGADCIQVREPAMGGRDLLRRTEAVVSAASGRAAVVVNDRPDVALAAGADGVHVGRGDLPVEAVRRIAGDRLVVGMSTGGLEEARAALAAGADGVGVGPMHASRTKQKDVIAGVEALRAVATWGGLPHLAIGGIDADRAAVLAAAGAKGVAVCAAVCGADDPAAATRAIVNAMRSRRPAAAEAVAEASIRSPA